MSAVSAFSAVEYRAIRDYAEYHGLVPGLSIRAEGTVHFRNKTTGELTSVGLITVLHEATEWKAKQKKKGTTA